MSAELTAEAALKLVGDIFVYHMPFNRALGLELERYEKSFAQLSFNNQPMMVGNWAQSILHGGVIASAQAWSAWAARSPDTTLSTKMNCASACHEWAPSIYAWITCAQAVATVLPPPAACCGRVIKSPSRASNCTTKSRFISPARPPLIWWVNR